MSEMIDPIVAEVRKARDAYAKKFNYDIQAMCRDLKNRQAQHSSKIVSRPAKKTRPPEIPLQ
ncbi:MAG: hypothetical protein L0Y73_05855 [Candidatus Aminicenantes bacterium]|nr:hypothetical protein [Candidatus Aminicenantes bacterium]